MKTLSTLLLIAAVAAGIDANSAEVTRIAAGDHTMLLTKDGKIYVSGKNDDGQLGDGHYFDSEISDNHYNATTFKPVEKDGVKFRSVTATIYNSYAIASDGALYAWGQNAYGQLGLVSVGTYSGIYTPTKVDDAKWAVVKGPLDNNSRYSYRRHIVGVGQEPHRATRHWRRLRDERVRDGS